MDDVDADNRLAAEQRARVLIDRQLVEAGWVVQDRKQMNLYAAQGVAVREVVMATGHGRADYLLYVDQRAVGVIEAKPVGTTLSGVEWQARWVIARQGGWFPPREASPPTAAHYSGPPLTAASRPVES